MLIRRPTHRMSSERFERWLAEFKKPYIQEKFIYSYKALENAHSELVIKHLLTPWQRRQVHLFIRQLPKMNQKRFQRFLHRFRHDSSALHNYSAKDFTTWQKYIISYYLYKKALADKLREIWR